MLNSGALVHIVINRAALEQQTGAGSAVGMTCKSLLSFILQSCKQIQALPERQLLLADSFHGFQIVLRSGAQWARGAPFSWLLWKGHFGALIGSIW